MLSLRRGVGVKTKIKYKVQNIYDYTEEEPALFPVPLPPPLLLLLLLTFDPVRCKIAWPKYELIVLTPAVAPSSALPPYS